MKIFVVLVLVVASSCMETDARAVGRRNRRQTDYLNQYFQQQYGDAYSQSQPQDSVYGQVDNQYDQSSLADYDQTQDYSDSSRSSDALQVVDDVLLAIKECVTEKLVALDDTLLVNSLVEALLENDVSDNSGSIGYAGRSGLDGLLGKLLGGLLGGGGVKGRAGGGILGLGPFKDINSNVLGGQTKDTFNKNTNNFLTFAPVANDKTKTTFITRSAKKTQDFKAMLSAIFGGKGTGKISFGNFPRAENNKKSNSIINTLKGVNNNSMKDSNIQVLSIGGQNSGNKNNFDFKNINFLKGRSFEGIQSPQYSAGAQYVQPQGYQAATTVYDNQAKDNQYAV